MPVWVGGRVLPDEAPAVSALDRGFLYGDGVFETVKVVDGVPLWLEEHLARLESGCRALGFEPPSRKEALDAVEALCDRPSGRSRFRVIVTRGVGGEGLTPSRAPRPAVVATLSAAARPPVSVRVLVAARPRLFPLPRAKTLNYVQSVLAREDAATHGADDALLIDPRDRVVEATAANLFAVAAGGLVTPSLDEGCLDGITRRRVLEIARELPAPVEERPLAVEELLRAEEVFLTSSVHGVVPVVAIGDAAVGKGAPGRVTRSMQESLLERERAEIAAQKGIVK